MTMRPANATTAANSTEYRIAIGVLTSRPTCFKPLTNVTIEVISTAAKMYTGT